jgi:hypothetical protein
MRLWTLAGGTVAAAAIVAAVLIGSGPSASTNADSPPPSPEAPPQAAAVSPAPQPASAPAREKMAQATKPANGGGMAWKTAEVGLARDEERRAALKLVEAQEALIRDIRPQKGGTKPVSEHPRPQGEKAKGPG